VESERQIHPYGLGGSALPATVEDEDLKTYEGMFLMDAGQTDFDAATQPIQTVLDRNGAEEVQLRKWDERRLAFDVKGRRRGLYVLTYFKAPPEAITSIERDVQLDEAILRVLILSADHIGAEKIAAPTPAEAEGRRRDTEAGDAARAADAKKAEEEEKAQAAAASEPAETAPIDEPAEAAPIDEPVEAAPEPAAAPIDEPTEAASDPAPGDEGAPIASETDEGDTDEDDDAKPAE
jgi:small subunit ribosomal protein S6